MFVTSVVGLLLLILAIWLQSDIYVRIIPWFLATKHSLDASSCPGYTVNSLAETYSGLTAQLSLSGSACNAFGRDVVNLTVQVTYETESRLHVNIFDTDQLQFVIPESVIRRPSSVPATRAQSSDLEFHYNPAPFAFWITRRSEKESAPIFDTRSSSISSVLPLDTNIYGLGEVVSSSGFRRDVGSNGSNGTIQTMWARDDADPLDENVSAGSDILLSTPPGAENAQIEYRLLGGTLDFYFFSGPTPQNVIEQYGVVVGLPGWQPAWAFGFQLCRWGYSTVNETREQVRKMREASVPLEGALGFIKMSTKIDAVIVIWNDIDLYHDLRDFTTDLINFPGGEMREFINELKSNHQHCAIRVLVFPDWFAEETQAWWTEALTNWSKNGVEFSGIWLDMNEASSFCEGSCGTGANLSESKLPFLLPGAPGNPITTYPECYNSTISGPSGNITINGSATYSCGDFGYSPTIKRRNFSVVSGANNGEPPYAIHNGNGKLSARGLASNGVHAGGITELDVHNLWGLMSSKATHVAMESILPGERQMMISRATFPSSGRYTGHWLGDNFSLWQYMHYDIQGIIQFQIFQVPFVGADTCGFNEELCNRWMQLSAFAPFYRNHNIKAAIGQEPYRWESVASASRNAMAIRYALLPYWYTLFANASTIGTPPVRALFFEFPDEPELFAVDRQFLVGRNILVTPVLTPGAVSILTSYKQTGIFPGRSGVIWRDWYTHGVVNSKPGVATTLSAPLGHINVHIRDGAALLLHADPAYTIAETRAGPFALLVSLSPNGDAYGTAYVDDGISSPPGPGTTLTFEVGSGQLRIKAEGSFGVEQKLREITILGVNKKPTKVFLRGRAIKSWSFIEVSEELMLTGVDGDLNRPLSVTWL
ncbi:hypothetical protein HWV62_40232 [Athelia sp. TMB]|nr:hypothetical protein HWV62_40232 [Athelia sp. TMB]